VDDGVVQIVSRTLDWLTGGVVENIHLNSVQISLDGNDFEIAWNSSFKIIKNGHTSDLVLAPFSGNILAACGLVELLGLEVIGVDFEQDAFVVRLAGNNKVMVTSDGVESGYVRSKVGLGRIEVLVQ
jgi:hypothetical protein